MSAGPLAREPRVSGIPREEGTSGKVKPEEAARGWPGGGGGGDADAARSSNGLGQRRSCSLAAEERSPPAGSDRDVRTTEASVGRTAQRLVRTGNEGPSFQERGRELRWIVSWQGRPWLATRDGMF